MRAMQLDAASPGSSSSAMMLNMRSNGDADAS
jgi:hypothetical protein